MEKFCLYQSTVEQTIPWIPKCLALHDYEQYPTASQLQLHANFCTFFLQKEHVFSFDGSKK